MKEELPAFVVMLSGGQRGDQPLYGRLWGSGFLPPNHQAVQLLGSGDPVLYLSDPPGIDRATRARMLAALADLERERRGDAAGPRIEQYEMAFQLQKSMPKLADFSDEPASTFELYGDDAKKRGTFSANCLMARRLVESGVRFVQLYHRDWDHHTNLPERIAARAKEVDQASAALVTDLKQRGLLDDTLVIWGGEFGRTAYCQGELTADNYGRDHHPRCFTMWLAGGGTKPGFTHGDDRRLLLQRGRWRRAYSRSARHDPASPGTRSRKAHIPFPGPRLPAHRYRGKVGPRDYCVRVIPACDFAKSQTEEHALQIEQALQRRILFGSREEIEGPEVAGLVGFGGGGILEDLRQQFGRFLGPAAPHDVAAHGRAPLVADLLEVGVQERIPVLVGPDAERFEIPAVLAVVQVRQFRPEFRGGRIFRVPQGDRALAANFGGLVSHERLHRLHQIELLLAAIRKATIRKSGFSWAKIASTIP